MKIVSNGKAALAVDCSSIPWLAVSNSFDMSSGAPVRSICVEAVLKIEMNHSKGRCHDSHLSGAMLMKVGTRQTAF